MLNAKTVGLYLLLISSIFGINIPHLEAQSNNGEYRVDTSYNAILEPYKIPGIDVSITPCKKPSQGLVENTENKGIIPNKFNTGPVSRPVAT